jgi:hypothetical protein
MRRSIALQPRVPRQHAAQTLGSQDAELHEAGVAKLYRERRRGAAADPQDRVSSAAACRPQLERLLRVIGEATWCW